MSEFGASYQSFLDDLVGVDPSMVQAEDNARPRFEIRDDATADWALRKLSQVEQQQRQRAAFVAAEIERVKTWQAREDAKDQRFADFLTACLRSYYDQLKDDGKVSERHKSYRLPHGTLTARAKEAQFELDENLLLAWCQTHRPGCIRTKQEIAWSDLKPLLRVVEVDAGLGYQVVIEDIDEATGEVRQMPVPGVRVKQVAGEVFQARPTLD
ncbi:MAG TPA: host-nuclease inhibitor Gam family protein [Alphaproteobacteria bacterium]|nr:host-nuclease inhibitor Gam family protein [Alphaproteobacteria bacterium]